MVVCDANEYGAVPINSQRGLIEVVVEAKAAGGRVRSLFPVTNQFVASDLILRQMKSGRSIYLSGARRGIEKTVVHLSKFSIDYQKADTQTMVLCQKFEYAHFAKVYASTPHPLNRAR
jgi:hypothetical protein